MVKKNIKKQPTTEEEATDELISYRGLCPACDSQLLIKQSMNKSYLNQYFVACSKFPKCRWTSYNSSV